MSTVPPFLLAIKQKQDHPRILSVLTRSEWLRQQSVDPALSDLDLSWGCKDYSSCCCSLLSAVSDQSLDIVRLKGDKNSPEVLSLSLLSGGPCVWQVSQELRVSDGLHPDLVDRKFGPQRDPGLSDLHSSEVELLVVEDLLDEG